MACARVAVSGLVLALAVSGCAAATAGDSDGCTFAFVSVTNSFTDRDVFLVDEHLVPIRQLTDDGRSYDPDLSPDGGRIAFVNARGSEPSESAYTELSGVSTIDVSGADERQLTRGQRDTSPRWAPDGSRLALIRTPDTGEPQLLLLDPGTGATTVVLDGGLRDLVWLTDEQIALSQFQGDRTVWRTLDLDTGVLSPAGLPPDADGESVVWSPDRTRVAFTVYALGGDPDARPAIQVYDLHTGERHSVPGSDTLQNEPILWTSQDNLLFHQNVQGADFDVAQSGDGGRSPETVIGRQGEESPTGVPVADNPACAP